MSTFSLSSWISKPSLATLVVTAGVWGGWTASAAGQDCAPPYGAQKSCAAPPRRTGTCKPARRNPAYDAEFERRLAEEVAAAVAEATLQAERERRGTGAGAGAGAGAPTEFIAPPPSGVVAGASNSFGIRGMEVTFPEWKLAMPSIQLPCLVHLRRDAEMLLDPGRAAMSRAGAASPAGTGAGAPAGMPNGVFIPFPQPAAGTGAPASTPQEGTIAPAREPAPRRISRTRERWLEDEYEFEEELDPSCAPPAACAPAQRATFLRGQAPREPIPAPSAVDEQESGPTVPPAPVDAEAMRIRRELEEARRELQATRSQLRELSGLVAQVRRQATSGRAIEETESEVRTLPGSSTHDAESSTVVDLFEEPAEHGEEKTESAASSVRRTAHSTVKQQEPARPCPSSLGSRTADASPTTGLPEGRSEGSGWKLPRFIKPRRTGAEADSGTNSHGPGHSLLRRG
jgi:hypothetical protein